MDYRAWKQKQQLKKEKRKKKKTTYGFIFITSLSFGVLAGWVDAAMEEAGPLPLRSSLVSIGRVASTISMLWEASFSLEGSLGIAGGKVASWATSFVVYVAFSVTSDCSTSLGGMLAIGRVLVGLSLPSSASLEAVSALQPEELKARMAGG